MKQSLKEKPENTLNPQSSNSRLLKQSNNNCHCDHHQEQPFIGTYHEAPLWMRYQELTIGYRINFSSFRLIFKSIFMVHNQTTNVWTHLIGAFILISTALFTCTPFINIFNSTVHLSKLPQQKDIIIGSGKSFIQNLTQTCFAKQSIFLHHNQSLDYDINQLIVDLCEKRQHKYQCFIQKSHEKQLRNWLEFHFSLNFDDFQHMKLKLQKQIVPQIVHRFQNKLTSQSQDLLFIKLNQSCQKIKNQNIGINYFNNISEESLANSTIQKNQLAKWPLIFYLLCNSITLLCSVTYHLFYPLSQKAHKFCICTDFAGISVLFGGSAIPCIYYGMYCYFEVAQIYITSIIIGAVCVFILSFTDKFQDRKNSTFRVIIYGIFACFMFTPLCHMTVNQLIFNNYDDPYSVVSSLQWYTLGLIFYALGGFFYSSQIPNKFTKTGKYDIFGHSHHYWHICVVLALMSIYFGCVQNYFTRKDLLCH